MFDAFLRATLKIAFGVVLLSLFTSAAVGVYAVWNPSVLTETLWRTMGTVLIILFASLFYVAACDIWFRINSGNRHSLDSGPIEVHAGNK